MENYIIFYKDNVLGVYSNYEKAKLYVLSCFQNNFLTENVKVKVYKKNSCYLLREEYIINNLVKKPENKQNIVKKIITKNANKTVNTNNNILNNINKENIEKLAENKIKIQHNLNMLKKQKELIKEREQVYNTDKELFDKFNKVKTENKTFEIPELFVTKYNIFLKLKESNTLSFENFSREYNPVNNYASHFVSNNYESSFNSKEKTDIILEKNLESDDISDSDEEFIINKMTQSCMYEEDSEYYSSSNESITNLDN